MYHGIINIYKEKGFTSHDVVAKLRGILKQKKIGHTGTLDPEAVGVLPVCLGKATKLCDMLTEKEKTYKAVMVLGKATDTQDITGNIISETDVNEKRQDITDELIKDTILSFVGEYDQIPPMYSAIKVNGRKLYELAREGIEIERKPRHVVIKDINIISIEYPYVTMEVSCSKGTYIRTLCHDIGIRLKTYGCMTELERTSSGIFKKDESVTLSEVEGLLSEGSLEKHLMAVDEMFKDYDSIVIDDKLNKLLYNGNSIPVRQIENISIKSNRVYRVYDFNNQFIGIYKETSGVLKPEKLFL